MWRKFKYSTWWGKTPQHISEGDFSVSGDRSVVGCVALEKVKPLINHLGIVIFSRHREHYYSAFQV